MARNICALSAAAALCSLAASAPAAAQSVFDGVWTVSRTGIGCTPTGAISVTISGGRISGEYFGGTGRHVVAGAVQKSGSFRFTGRSTETVYFSGAIKGTHGSGEWTVVGRKCGGPLTMSKQ